MKLQSDRSFSNGLQLLTESKTLTTFVIGAIATGVLDGAVFQLLTNWLGTTSSSIAIIAFGAVIVLVVFIWVIGRLVRRLRPAPPLLGKRAPGSCRGLILLVSNEPTALKAIEWHRDKLERCWLVCSSQSTPLASKIKDDLEKKGVSAELVLINDVFDVVECKRRIGEIYEHLPEGLQEPDVILDFTGMTAVASVGAVLACLDESRSIQYTPAVFDKELHALQPRDPVEIILHWGLIQATPQKERA
ncbi:MAG: hypothetical protein KIT57_10395 [Blastocatellales bacterium]|nr:hypothetical protein [Blastocatellales bacterium]